MQEVPKNAIGTEPSTSHPTRRRLTVPLVKWTIAPTGRITTAATRSLEIAVDGLIPKSRISIGVIRAPPPAPVKPTRKPTTGAPEHDIGINLHDPYLITEIDGMATERPRALATS